MAMPLITVPDITSSLATITAVANPLFSSLFAVALFAAGILVGGMFVSYIIRAIKGGIGKVVGRGRRGRRRR